LTLIQGAELGGVLVAMTSDTRQALAYKSGTGVKYIPFVDAEKSKVERIAPYVIYGGGGLTGFVNEVKKRLTAEVPGGQFLLDFRMPFEKVIEDLQTNKRFGKQLADDTTAQIMISGFNEDGSTGVLTYNTGVGCSVEYKQHTHGAQDLRIIAPSADQLDAILKTVKFPEVSDVSEVAAATLSFFISIQAAAFETDAETVSETCNYCVLYRDPQSGEFACFEDSIKVNE
jgi:hypothetical protein